MNIKFKAQVVSGRGEGRKLGFPTINLEVDGGSVTGLKDLGPGVYACKVKTKSGIWAGALNYGSRPTFNISDVSLEIFLPDFSGDLYGHKVAVTVYNKIRDIKKFADTAGLKKQIEIDVKRVREILTQIKHD